MTYSLTYTVTASSRMEAIANATSLIRTGVKLRGVNRAEEVIPGSGIWKVSLNLWEDV